VAKPTINFCGFKSINANTVLYLAQSLLVAPVAHHQAWVCAGFAVARFRATRIDARHKSVPAPSLKLRFCHPPIPLNAQFLIFWHARKRVSHSFDPGNVFAWVRQVCDFHFAAPFICPPRSGQAHASVLVFVWVLFALR
jgi:hypothetical protein